MKTLALILLSLTFITIAFFAGRYSKDFPRESKMQKVINLIDDDGGVIHFAPGVYYLDDDSIHIDTIYIHGYGTDRVGNIIDSYGNIVIEWDTERVNP